MPARELPAELKEIAPCSSHLYFQTKCEYCRERYHALLAAIPIVERRTAKECAEIAYKALHNCKNRNCGIPACGGYKNDASLAEQAILSRWKMED